MGAGLIKIQITSKVCGLIINALVYSLDIPCECPLPPNYGHTSTCSGSVSAGYKLSYYCNGVRILAGDRSRICQGNGNWTGSDPSCVRGT